MNDFSNMKLRVQQLSNILRVVFLVGMMGMPGIVRSDTLWTELDEKCDSLKNLLRSATLETRHEFEIYREITRIYAFHATDSVIVYAPRAVSLARQLGEFLIEMDCLCHLGAAYAFQGDSETAISYFEQVRSAGMERKDRGVEARAVSLIGFAYMNKGQYNAAIDYYLKALALYEETGHTEGCLTSYSNMAEIYRKLNNAEFALRCLDQAVVLCEELKPAQYERYVWRIPHIYNEYAACYLEEGLLPEAEEYAMKADSINTGVGIINKCNTKLLLAKINLKLEEYDAASVYAAEALVQAEMLKDDDLRMNVWQTFSDIYLAQQRYGEAEALAMNVFRTDSANVDISRRALANIALANIYMNDWEKAALYFKKYSALNDLYSQKSFHTAMSDMAVTYETEKKEMRIADLEREKLLYVFMGIAGLLLAGTLGVAFRQRMKSTQKEKQLIAARSILAGEMSERTRLASDIHDRLSGNLSALKMGLGNSESDRELHRKVDNSIEEVRRVAHNLMPVSLQFGLKTALEDFAAGVANLHFHFFGDEFPIQERMAFLVYCCASELVNNSLRHSGAEYINLQLVQSEKYVSLTVQDDGCGFDEKSAMKGMGLWNIYERVASCNGKIDVFTSPGEGTEITIEIRTDIVL